MCHKSSFSSVLQNYTPDYNNFRLGSPTIRHLHTSHAVERSIVGAITFGGLLDMDNSEGARPCAPSIPYVGIALEKLTL